jgi:broad-specificity NMP kinase
MMKRAYYESDLAVFLEQDESMILGRLASNNQFALESLQRNVWIEEIKVLKKELAELEDAYIIFEYTIPRIGNRIDNILIYRGFIFLLEFKVGEDSYPKHAVDQVMDYALDLKYFHKESSNKKLVPILICTAAKEQNMEVSMMKDGIFNVLYCNKDNIKKAINQVIMTHNSDCFEASEWSKSVYMPTPTIIEAAQALYRGHKVEEISRSDAGAHNLNTTTAAINKIIDYSKANHRKSICFITGVPGAGKTLAGLNIANERHKFDEEEHAVFLSGNQPLVEVLQEALARDESKRSGVTKKEAERRTKSFIQIIHKFRDTALISEEAPLEKIAIFDEAQRAWNAEALSKFMRQKKGVPGFYMSEPDFLISIMNRHIDWAVIICLVGGGQEIYTGEAGLGDWFTALRNDYQDWDVYLSSQITDSEYVGDSSIERLLGAKAFRLIDELHLATSLRSFRSQNLAAFIKALLDNDTESAKELYKKIKDSYPLVITRDIENAKAWVRSKARGTERYGLLASSGAKRLRSEGIWVLTEINNISWFLNDSGDVDSAYYLEVAASEFKVQGLEVDYSLVAWDANFRYKDGEFGYYRFMRSQWQNIRNEQNKVYLKNAYRVLLTRARQGMVIYVPKGDNNDPACKCSFYDGTFDYLKEIGIEEV